MNNSNKEQYFNLIMHEMGDYSILKLTFKSRLTDRMIIMFRSQGRQCGLLFR